MLLRYSLGLLSESRAIDDAVRKALNSGVRTRDISGSATTSEFGDAVVAQLEKLMETKCL